MVAHPWAKVEARYGLRRDFQFSWMSAGERSGPVCDPRFRRMMGHQAECRASSGIPLDVH